MHDMLDQFMTHSLPLLTADPCELCCIGRPTPRYRILPLEATLRRPQAAKVRVNLSTVSIFSLDPR